MTTPTDDLGDVFSDPHDVTEAITRLELLADWLDEQYPNEAAALRTVADDLRSYKAKIEPKV